MENLSPQELNLEAFKCELRVMPNSYVINYKEVLSNPKSDAHLRNMAGVSLYYDKKVDKAERVNDAMRIWADIDDGEANLLLSAAYFQNSKKNEGVERLRRAIKLGNIQAQLRAGYCTLMGIGVKSDINKAANIFKRLATQKVPEAVYFTGALYLVKNDVTPLDPEKAKKLLMWSVKHGCKFAEFEHGISLLAKPETKAEGIEYIYRAGRQQEVRAMMWLAIELAQGTILEKDMDASQEYMQKCITLKFKPAIDAINEVINSGFND